MAHMNFYIRCNDDFCPIASYGSETLVFELFKSGLNVPNGNIISINENNLETIKDLAKLKKGVAENNIEKVEKGISVISNMNNTVKEKIASIIPLSKKNNEYELKITQSNYVKDFCEFLGNMLIEITCDNRISKFKSDNYIFVGIDVDNPTVDNIVNGW